MISVKYRSDCIGISDGTGCICHWNFGISHSSMRWLWTGRAGNRCWSPQQFFVGARTTCVPLNPAAIKMQPLTAVTSHTLQACWGDYWFSKNHQPDTWPGDGDGGAFKRWRSNCEHCISSPQKLHCISSQKKVLNYLAILKVITFLWWHKYGKM